MYSGAVRCGAGLQPIDNAYQISICTRAAPSPRGNKNKREPYHAPTKTFEIVSSSVIECNLVLS